MPSTLTRRSFLVAGAGALAAAGLGRGLRLVGGAPTLAAPRMAAYAALTEAVATGPAMRLPAGAAVNAVSAFSATYAGWPTERRAHADMVLDRIRREGPSAYASHDALAIAAVTIGPDDDGRALLAI
ncbi:MAG: hypothetical protein ABI950_13005 [Solirubrobacteraceae bacterium]